MNRPFISLSNVSAVFLAAALAVAAPTAAQAQKAKPAAKKPPVKAAPKKATGPIVLGTTQLPGDFGKLGQTYTIGKDNPINFTLDSARYAHDRYVVGNNTWVPLKDQKLLILRYTVHNPQPREQSFYWASIRFTAVDAQDTNREYIQAVTRAGSADRSAFSASLKPAQKIQMETAILVPSDGVVPKLIVERQRGEPVIRYDLHGKVEKLPEPFADPADSEGATLRADVPVKAGEFYACGPYDIKLDAIAYTTELILNRDLKKGYRNVTATFTLKNVTQTEQPYYWGHFVVEMRDADGEKIEYTQAMLKASRNEATSGKLAPGEEVRVRFFFPIPENVEAKSISLREGLLSGNKGRLLTFDLAGVASAAATASAAQ